MNPELNRTMELIARRTAQAQSRAVVAQDQLPLWSERLRGLPNALARSALFTCAGKTEPRREYRRDMIVSLQNFEVRYTGEELRQDDQDVWLQVAHLARVHPLGDQVEVAGHALLTALGWGRSARSYARLRASIARMREAAVWVTFTSGEDGWSGNLISSLEWKDAGAGGEHMKWKLYFDRKILALFKPDTYTLIEWEKRLTLGPLAKWLHSFYSSHREPMPYRVLTLHALSGSLNGRLNSFRARLREALEELAELRFLSNWTIDPKTDTVQVRRFASATALQHEVARPEAVA